MSPRRPHIVLRTTAGLLVSRLASAGPRLARTQGAELGGAKRKPEDDARRRVSAAARRGGRGPAVVLASALAAIFLAFAAPVALAAPTVTTDPVTEHGITTAHLSGSITTDPGVAETYAFFQYSPAGEEHGLSGEENWTAGPGYLGPFPESSTEAVTDTLTGLHAARKYEVRLVAQPYTDFLYYPSPAVQTFETDPAPVEPIPAVSAATDVSYTTAKISGTVDPEGGNPESGGAYVPIHWELELRDSTADTPYAPVAAGDINSGEGAESDEPIEVGPAELTGLAPGHLYRYLLFIHFAGQPVTSGVIEGFTTLAVDPPLVSNAAASNVAYTTATASGEVELANVDPAFNAFCRFEYITEAEWEANASAFPTEGAPSVGCTPETIEGTEPPEATPVQADLTNLAPATEYHLRLLASNQGGTGSEEAAVFETEEVLAPVVSIEDATFLTDHSAHFAGTVAVANPDEAFNASCAFQYVSEAHFGAEGFENPGQIACDHNPVTGAEAQPVSVSADPPLEPNTTYHLRLLAENLGGQGIALAADTFKTDSLPPTVATGTNTPIGDEEVHLRGYVNRHNSEVTDCHFEYGPSTAYGQSAPCAGVDEVQSVNINATAGQFRLSFGGQSTPDLPFDAPPELVQAQLEALSSVGVGNVTVSGEPTIHAYRDPYRITFTGALADKDVEQIAAADGTAPLSGGEGFGVATVTPGFASGLALLNGSPGNETLEVDADLDQLQPGVTYHFRLSVQTSEGGIVASPEDAIFQVQSTYVAPPSCENEARRTEQHSAYLPECRAYEMVSPPEKNGGDIMADTGRTQIAAEGDAARFSTLTPFGDTLGTSVASDYLGLRGPGGWSTHAITPHQTSTTYKAIVGGGLQSLYLGLSSDLSKGLFVGWSPLTNDPSVAGVTNLYLREDLKTAGAGSYQLRSSCPLCEQTRKPLPPLSGNFNVGGQPRFKGASADYGHILFSSQQPLLKGFEGENCSDLSDANSCPGKLYESDHGTLRLVGLVPPLPQTEAECTTTCEASKFGSQAGQDTSAFPEGVVSLTPNAVSSDGSRISFTVPSSPGSPSGALYMREDGTRTVQLNSFECCGEEGKPSSAPARYWGASDDGSRVFFTSAAKLTSDASGNGDQNLYMYDVDAPAGHHLTLISVDDIPADGGNVVNVQGTSSDGHFIYFAAVGELVAGHPVIGVDRALYVWHDGTVHYITSMHEFTDNVDDTNTISWTFFQPTARVTPDGLHLLFSSSGSGEGPTGYDQGHCQVLDAGCREFYLYSYPTQQLSCVTCNPGAEVATASAFTAERLNSGASATSPYQNHPLSNDGGHVFFSTGEALVSTDTNGAIDAYDYDTASGTVHLLSSGTDKDPSYFIDSTPEGSGALLVSRQNLLGTDSGTEYDLYDARIDGGFPEPPAAHAICEGDTCQGAPSPPPSSASPGTGAAKGPADQPILRCPKGSVRRHGKCVTKKPKKHHKSKKRHQHRAGSNHGAGK